MCKWKYSPRAGGVRTWGCWILGERENSVLALGCLSLPNSSRGWTQRKKVVFYKGLGTSRILNYILYSQSFQRQCFPVCVPWHPRPNFILPEEQGSVGHTIYCILLCSFLKRNQILAHWNPWNICSGKKTHTVLGNSRLNLFIHRWPSPPSLFRGDGGRGTTSQRACSVRWWFRVLAAGHWCAGDIKFQCICKVRLQRKSLAQLPTSWWC